jgi:nucleoside-diphosphate-sugar epimerase
MANVLVTGGAGFIGSHLVAALLKQGDFVRVLDNFSTGKRENLEGMKVEMIEGDIRNRSLVAQAMKGIEIVFHEAAFVSVPLSMNDPISCFDINQRGTEIVLETAREVGVKRVVLASSAAVYGDSTEIPLKEETKLFPMSPYAVSKRVTEIYAELYTRSFGLEVVALRYFNVFGPRQRPDSMYAAAVPIFTRNLVDKKQIVIYGDGEQTRDLVFVDDIVKANLLAAQHTDAPGQVFNVSSGVEITVNQLITALIKNFPDAMPAKYESARAGDIFRSLGDPSKSQKMLGFNAGTSLDEGLRAVVAWMAKP